MKGFMRLERANLGSSSLKTLNSHQRKRKMKTRPVKMHNKTEILKIILLSKIYINHYSYLVIIPLHLVLH
jgi:hypothetical protein